jgi:pimeloyl-ACP methyl ester carboxylesterase
VRCAAFRAADRGVVRDGCRYCSHRITAHDTVEALAADILQWAPPHFAIAGLSMGGIVAMEVLRQAPDRVDRIALLDTNPKAELDEVKAAREPQIMQVEAGELQAVMRDEMKPRYLVDGPRKKTILDLCMEMAMDLGPRCLRAPVARATAAP